VKHTLKGFVLELAGGEWTIKARGRKAGSADKIKQNTKTLGGTRDAIPIHPRGGTVSLTR